MEAKLVPLQTRRLPLEALIPDPDNPRLHDARNLEAIQASLARFGQVEPLVVQKGTHHLLAGHGRLEALRKLGVTEAEVVEVDIAGAEAKALAVALNRTAELADWDVDKLIGLVQGDPDTDWDALGFSEKELQALVAKRGAGVDPDDIPELTGPVETQVGDLWRCGAHRVICGDATDAATVAQLFGQDRPFLMVTDPPYGVEYDAAWRAEQAVGSGHRIGKVENDDRADWGAAWALFPGDVAYVWHAGVFADVVALSLIVHDFEIRAGIVWKKQSFVLSRGAYHWGHEPVWAAVRKGRDARFTAQFPSTIWEIANASSAGGQQDDADTAHSTQKPVACMERPILNHGAPGDFVYDPFLGSGTTMIAAERTGRRALCVEISPHYVEMAVRRWEALTGQKAQREAA